LYKDLRNVAIATLNRRFYEWVETEPPDPEFRRAMGLGDGGLDWEELLNKRRVVILAEAGSGKSTEMAERARLIALHGRYAFLATAEDIGRDGLEGGLSARDRSSLKAWLASTADAWFLIDSVDGAKSTGTRFEKVLRRLADGIQGAEERAHVILSGRITDWEFRKDLASLKDKLPIMVPASMPERTPEEELVELLSQEGRRKEGSQTEEKPFVALMAPLDRDRVRVFAEVNGAPNLDQFLGQIDAANLWMFARRPLDLDWLVQFWQSKGRFGSLTEMVELSIS
jgi:hypothetical protein